MKHLITCVLGLFTAAAVVATAAHAPARADRLVYIGTYTNETIKGIYAFRFDDSTGALTPLGLAAETSSPSFLIASADGRFVFAVNELATFEGAPGSVSSFSVDRATAKLTQLSVQATKGAGPCHLALDKTGRYLAVANYSGGNFSLFPVGTDGKLQPAIATVAGEAEPPAPPPPGGAPARPVQKLGHFVAFDATNKFLITSDKGLDKLLVFKFDAATGKLTPNQPPSASLPPRTGPRHFAFSPDSKWLFSKIGRASCRERV